MTDHDPDENSGSELKGDDEEARALDTAEDFILQIARTRRVSSLVQLRAELEGEDAQCFDPTLLRTALWSLLNENRLELRSDRTLHVAGEV